LEKLVEHRASVRITVSAAAVAQDLTKVMVSSAGLAAVELAEAALAAPPHLVRETAAATDRLLPIRRQAAAVAQVQSV
jgi:hypothetical protein